MLRRIAIILIILGVIAGLIAGWQRYRLEKASTAVEIALDLNDIVQMVPVDSLADLSRVLRELQTEGVHSIVITVPANEPLTAIPLAVIAGTVREAGLVPVVKVGHSVQADEPQMGSTREVDTGTSTIPASGQSEDPLHRPQRVSTQRKDRLGFEGAVSEAELATILQQVQPRALLFDGEMVTGYPDRLAAVADLLQRQGVLLGVQEFSGLAGENQLARLMPLHILRVHTIYPRELPRYDRSRAVARYLRAVRERSYRFLYVRLMKLPGSPQYNRDLIREMAGSLQAAGYSLAEAQLLPAWEAGTVTFILAVGGWLGAALWLGSLLLSLLPGNIFNSKLHEVVAGPGLIGLLAVVVILIGVYSLYDALLARQVLAFLAAITFPSLAVLPQRWAVPSQTQPNRAKILLYHLSLPRVGLAGSGSQSGNSGLGPVDPDAGRTSEWGRAVRCSLLNFIEVNLISLAGAAVMVAALGDYRFMVKVVQFRGVKAMFVLPLLVVAAGAIIYILQHYGSRERCSWWQVWWPGQGGLRWSHILILVSLVGAGIVYIGRTGNFLIPVPGVELWLRRFLEDFLGARPRTREFLLGHPLLVLGLGLYTWGRQREAMAAIVVATMGQISLVNTFAHAHAPLVLSLVRSLYAFILGGFLGTVALHLLLPFLGHRPPGFTSGGSHYGQRPSGGRAQCSDYTSGHNLGSKRGRGSIQGPSTVLISGYHGFGNAGDEAILAAMLQQLREQWPRARFLVLSGDPARTAREHGVEAVARYNVGMVARALQVSDIFISGGGTLLQDATSSSSIYYYLGMILLARWYGLPVFLYAQGIGPINHHWHRLVTAWVLQRVQFITVRDRPSYEHLLQWGVAPRRVAVTADPVFALQVPPAPALADECEELFSRQRPVLFVCLRPWPGLGVYLSSAAAVLDRVIREWGWQVLFLPLHFPNDYEVARDCAGRMREEAVVWPRPLSPRETVQLFRLADYCLGMRLHSLIFAARWRVPLVGIVYDPKVDSFLRELKLQELAVPLPGQNRGETESIISPPPWDELLLERLGRLKRQHRELRDHLNQVVGGLEERARRTPRLIAVKWEEGMGGSGGART